jgi:ATP-dependent RNA helicase DDX24/MAK5
VNSIKTARRVDGLLRALGFNCRAIHAQLQQRQRLRALESYRSSTDAVLVATDVAARGLDIPSISSVVHYDVARSPQVYIHRSGRTARAGASGLTVSLVAPEDTAHHNAICAAQTAKTLPVHKVDLMSLPMLRSRVKLAKKVCKCVFICIYLR